MGKTLKFGVIGTNFISDRFGEAIKKTPMAKMVAVLSRTEEKGKAFATAHGISKVYTKEQDFLLDKDIDAVYIAVPNALHFAYAEKALEYGKHVLLEKPACLCRKELDTLLSKAQEKGKLLLEAMRPAFDPAYQILAEALPKIGKIRFANLDFCQYSSRYDAFLQGDVQRAFDPAFGNAAVMDIGVYPLFIAVMLFGEPKSLTANSLFLANGFEGMGQITLHYSEMLCSVTYSKITQSATPSVILGEKGSLLIDKLTQPTQIIFRKIDGKEEPLPLAPNPNNMVYEIETFAQLIQKGEITHPSTANAATTISLIDCVRQSQNIRFSPADPLFEEK